MQDSQLTQCILLTNRMKEFRHNKTKLKQKNKFNSLCNKISGYMLNNSSFDTFCRHRYFGRLPIPHLQQQHHTSPTQPTKLVYTWVVNLSSNPLTKVQETLLSKGPNFAIVAKCSTRGAYITAVEEACIRLFP